MLIVDSWLNEVLHLMNAVIHDDELRAKLKNDEIMPKLNLMK